MPTLTPRSRLAAALAASLWAALTMAATTVAAQGEGMSLAGRMGNKALLVQGGRSFMLQPGETKSGVRLVAWDGDTALLDRDGRTLRLQIGAAPVSLGAVAANASDREVVIAAGPGGHFVTDGSINGHGVRFMVDTGATLVALPLNESERLGVDLQSGRAAVSQTAAGAVPVVLVTLSRLRLGDLELANVPAVVTPSPMPYVLLGNSVLSRLQMRRENDVMRLGLR